MFRNGYRISTAFKPYAQIDYREYIDEISKFTNRNVELGFASMETLKYFLASDATSAYQIFNNLKSKANRIAYKNVNKRVHRLASLNLIEKVERKYKHNAKCYKLTTGGLFSLIFNYKDFIFNDTRKFLQYYSDNVIFKTFVYPYFEQDTLLQLDHLTAFFELFTFLTRCCELTERVLSTLNKGEPAIALLGRWDHIPGEVDFMLLGVLDTMFGIEWVTKQNVKIEKFDNGNAIKILSNKNFLFIRLEDKKNKAIIKTDDGNTFELNVLDGTYLYAIYKSASERAEEEITHQTNLLVPLLPFSLITKCIFNKDQAIILAKDEKFIRLLQRTKGEFLDNYNVFNELTKSK